MGQAAGEVSAPHFTLVLVRHWFAVRCHSVQHVPPTRPGLLLRGSKHHLPQHSLAETNVLTQVAPGPIKLCTLEDLTRLQHDFCFSYHFRGLSAMSLAAEISVAIWDNVDHGGHDIRQRDREP